MKEFNLPSDLITKLRRLNFEEVIGFGNYQLESGDLETGIECYKFANSTLTDTDLKKPVALLFIANGLVHVENFKEAKEYCQRALNAIPKAMEKSVFTNVKHPVEHEIQSLMNYIDSNQPNDLSKASNKDSDEIIREFTNISDELVWELADRGMLRMRLDGETEPVYGFIVGRFRSGTEDSIQYEFTQLINYDPDEEPLDEEEYDVSHRYVDLEEIIAIKNLESPTPDDLKFEKFTVLMERIENAFNGNFDFQISPQGNALFLNSECIDSPISAIKALNIMLENNNDWEVFNAMNFDLIVLRGEQTYKLSSEKVYEIFQKR